MDPKLFGGAVKIPFTTHLQHMAVLARCVGGGGVDPTDTKKKRKNQQPIHSIIAFPAIQGAAKPKPVQGSAVFFGCGNKG